MKKLDALISVFKEFKEELNKDSSGAPNMPSTAGSGAGGTINSQIGFPFGKDEDGKPKGHSSFTMDHINAVVKMPHHEAKKHAHAAVDSSSATPVNKKKMKMMVDSSKSSGHLAQGMSNFMLAHPGEGLKVKKSDVGFAAKNDEVLKTDKNGQWSLEKDFSGPAARALAAKHPMPSAAPAVGKEYSGPAARSLAAKHPMPTSAETSAGKKNSLLDSRRNNVLKSNHNDVLDVPSEDGNYEEDREHTSKLLAPHPKSGNRGMVPIPLAGRKLEEDKPAKTKTLDVSKVDPDENVNISHPQGKAKMANGINKGEGTNECAASSKPHNKEKFKVMDEVEEKSSKKEAVKGLPYDDKSNKKRNT